MKKNFKWFLLTLLFFLLTLAGYLFIGTPPQAEKIIWGVNFSQKHSQNLRLNWKENYLALLDDLEARNFKLAVHWDLIEPEKDRFYFDDLDWQIKEAEKRNAKILLVIGMKSGRWPECHIPDWAKNLSKKDQQTEILEMLAKIVLRYRQSEAIEIWQVENEAFFPFGECPWVDKKFLKKEIELVHSLDHQKRKILISDSGEGSLWIQAAQFGDLVGTTMYRKVWFSFSWIKIRYHLLPKKLGFYVSYPLNPTFYWRKAKFIKKLFNKEVICIEFQAEPWCPTLLYDCQPSEQEKTMDLEQFKKNIEFAKETGFKKFYLWGGEWWFWLKEIENKPEIWNEAKKLF